MNLKKFAIGLQKLIDHNRERDALKLYLHTCRNPAFGEWKFTDWQKEDIKKVVLEKIPEIMLLRCRGGSKSRDASIIAVFLAYQYNPHGDFNRVLWYSGTDMQLRNIRQYFIENAYVESVTHDRVNLYNGNHIKLRIMTINQAVSPRADVIIYDEEQGFDLEIYQMSIGTLAGGACRKIHLGTTEFDSVLDLNYQRLAPRNAVSLHTVEDCSWMDRQKTLELFEGLPQWIVDSQLYCKWVRPGGRCFPNVESVESLRDWYKTCFYFAYGSDPNPKSGHSLVGVAYIKRNGAEMIYVFDSYQLEVDTFKHCAVMHDLIVKHKNDQFFGGIELESQQGYEVYKIYNKEFDKDPLIRVKTWNEKEKLERILHIRKYPILVDKNLGDLWRQISAASWDEKSPQPRLSKSPDQHLLDGFIHACSYKEFKFRSSI